MWCLVWEWSQIILGSFDEDTVCYLYDVIGNDEIQEKIMSDR